MAQDKEEGGKGTKEEGGKGTKPKRKSLKEAFSTASSAITLSAYIQVGGGWAAVLLQTGAGGSHDADGGWLLGRIKVL
jgi:hypothetical protein